MDPDQDQQNVSPYLDPYGLILIVFLKEYFEKNIVLKKMSVADNKSMKNYSSCRDFIIYYKVDGIEQKEI